MSKIVFILPVFSQPRYRKRINAISRAGSSVQVLYFQRRYFRGSAIRETAEYLGRIDHGAYGRRILKLLAVQRKVRSFLGRGDIVYAFGLDMALLALVASLGRSISLVYEVGDIRKVQLGKGPVSKIVRLLERFVLRRAQQTVVTAEGFREGYYSKYFERCLSRIRVIENKLDFPPECRPRPKIYEGERPVVIGYFGVLRCPQTWETLKALARKGNGKVHIVVRGYPLGVEVEREVKGKSYIRYDGEYVVPDDLSSMYAAVDLVWGCYPALDVHREGNWQWARTNRFYESCYFRRPIIALAGTDEACEVRSRRIGIAVDLMDPEKAADVVLNALPEKLKMWQREVGKVPSYVCTYTNEHSSLLRDLNRCFHSDESQQRPA